MQVDVDNHISLRLILIVGLGSFIGGAFRFIISRLIQGQFLFPYGTLCVNLIGCLVMGIILGLMERSAVTPEWRLFLATGICGGFTTYSAFASETFVMMRMGYTSTALLYVFGSLVLGVLFTFIGYLIPRIFV